MSWRDAWRVHPAADLFPMMGDDELDELGKDIKKNGLQQPLVAWRDGDEKFLLDGRNRLEAMERYGVEYSTPERYSHEDLWWYGLEEDPQAIVMSLNVRRRHLTQEQKRECIATLLKLNPKQSDRKVAKDVGVDHKTVGAVRQRVEASGEIPQRPGTLLPKVKGLPAIWVSDKWIAEQARMAELDKQRPEAPPPMHYMPDLVAEDAEDNLRTQAIHWFEQGRRVERLLDEDREMMLRFDQDPESIGADARRMILIAHHLQARARS